jgi:hypothetical protein
MWYQKAKVTHSDDLQLDSGGDPALRVALGLGKKEGNRWVMLEAF